MVDDVLLSWSDLVLLGNVSSNFLCLEFCCQSGNACFNSVEEACDALNSNICNIQISQFSVRPSIVHRDH